MANLYQIWQDVNTGYDTYDSAVVCADNEEEARNTELGERAWTSPENVQVKKIGKADKHQAKGIVVASFNAG